MNIERKKVYSYFFKNEFRLHVDQIGPCTRTEGRALQKKATVIV